MEINCENFLKLAKLWIVFAWISEIEIHKLTLV